MFAAEEKLNKLSHKYLSSQVPLGTFTPKLLLFEEVLLVVVIIRAKPIYNQ